MSRLGRWCGAWVIYRYADARAVTIRQHVAGFHGWRRVWWERREETAFPDWKTKGVFYPASSGGAAPTSLADASQGART